MGSLLATGNEVTVEGPIWRIKARNGVCLDINISGGIDSVQDTLNAHGITYAESRAQLAAKVYEEFKQSRSSLPAKRTEAVASLLGISSTRVSRLRTKAKKQNQSTAWQTRT